jgi:two-component system cell cycle response regulator DivK
MTNSVTVLIVEDNEMNRDMLQRRLQKRGYSVLIAVDGPSGLETTIKELPDIILMDINLPGMDGMEVTRRIKSANLTKTIPIIGLTALGRMSDKDAIFASGCDELETKPVDFVKLIEKMTALVKK